MKPKVKICGITNIKDALEAVWFGADALGFVFYRGSKRYINPKEAKKIVDILPPWVIKVGLFVDEKISEVRNIAKECKLDFIQLHGNEDIKYLRKLKGLKVIKAIRIKDKDSFRNLDNLPCDLVLFDAYSNVEFGGTGNKFNWQFASQIKKIKKPYIISGGLTPSNVFSAVKRFLPYAVDVSSGVERKPGIKDKNLMKEFIANAKNNKRVNNIKDYINICHKIAREKGWWDKERSDGEVIALMHSELSECLEVMRNHGLKEAIAEELSDCLIRIFDYCGEKKINLEEALVKKIEKNKTRPYRHNKRF